MFARENASSSAELEYGRELEYDHNLSSPVSGPEAEVSGTGVRGLQRLRQEAPNSRGHQGASNKN